MKSLRFRSALTFCLGFAALPAVYGQGWPQPAKTPNTPVLCPASISCTGQVGKPTAPYSLPIATFTGRYLDSQYSKDIQFNFRTARAYKVSFAPDRGRVYMILGSALAAFDIKTFFSRLEAGEPLMGENEVPVAGNSNHNPPEKFLRWGQWFYAESAGWQIPLADGQDRLFGFDWDDRGYIYLAYSVYGWGVALDEGGNSATRMTNVFQQVSDGEDVPPSNIMSFKASDGSYYAIVSGESSQNSNLWYTGTKNQWAAERRGYPKIAIYRFAKDDSGSRIAVADLEGSVKIFTSDSLVKNSPIAKFLPRSGVYSGIDTDGTNFYAVSTSGSGAFISVFAPSGTGYANIGDYPVGASYFGGYPDLHYGAGYLTVFGPEAGASGNIRLFKLSGTVPTEVPLGNYFANFYTVVGQSKGYVFPQGTSTFHDAMVYHSGSKDYLVAAATGFGDVYELANVTTSCPALTNSSAYVSYLGPNSGCTGTVGDCNANEAVAFQAYPNGGYIFTCGSHTYDWDFGDKTPHDGNLQTTHKYADAGSYNLTLTITNSLGSVKINQKVSVSGSSGATGSGSAPTVTRIVPALGAPAGGTPVTITGSNFQAGATVKFGNALALNVTVTNATTITAVTPAGGGIASVVVTNPDSQVAIAAGAFTYGLLSRGDANGDGAVTVADAFYLISYLFANGPAAVSGDANGDGVVTVADAFYLINYLFSGGPAPASVAGVASQSVAIGTGLFSLGSAAATSEGWVVPVYASGGRSMRGLAIAINHGPAKSVTIRPAGAAKSASRVFEASPASADQASFIASFDRTLAVNGSSLVAEVVAIAAEDASGPVSLSVDAERSAIDMRRNDAPNCERPRNH